MDETKIYSILYKEGKKTWENPSRKKFITKQSSRLSKPLSCLDIGCGAGLNTCWIGNIDKNLWIGIDTLSKKELNIPRVKSGEFLQTDFYSGRLKPFENIFNLVVDQGSILVKLEKQERAQYIKTINKYLVRGGIYVGMVVIGKGEPIIFPDGRKRVMYSMEDFKKSPFSQFTILDSLYETYEANSKYNPLDKKISVLQIAMKK